MSSKKSMKLRKDRAGRTLYPVCGFLGNQHKLYNAHDRIMNAISDAEDAGEDVADLRAQQYRLEELIGIFNSQVYDGLVYATWRDLKAIREYLGGYDMRHDMVAGRRIS